MHLGEGGQHGQPRTLVLTEPLGGGGHGRRPDQRRRDAGRVERHAVGPLLDVRV